MRGSSRSHEDDDDEAEEGGRAGREPPRISGLRSDVAEKPEPGERIP